MLRALTVFVLFSRADLAEPWKLMGAYSQFRDFVRGVRGATAEIGFASVETSGILV